ncbi:MAG: hypothetical protein IJT98_03515 [Prevotella sp.]|nr:hypothetical protein [Prevotella sp.]
MNNNEKKDRKEVLENLEKTKLFKAMLPSDAPQRRVMRDAPELDSYKTLANTYNRRHGKQQGKYIHVFNASESQMAEETVALVVCVTYEHYLRQKHKEIPADWWKAYVAKKKS